MARIIGKVTEKTKKILSDLIRSLFFKKFIALAVESFLQMTMSNFLFVKNLSRHQKV